MKDSKIVNLDSEFRVRVSGGNYTLEALRDVTNSKTKEVRKEWLTNGFHGSMKSCLKGYVRHSIDACSDVVSIISRLDNLESGIDKTLARVKK